MTKSEKHKSKQYEKWYGEPYKPKTLVEVRRCMKCGRDLPEKSTARRCPYCSGKLQTICRPVERERGAV